MLQSPFRGSRIPAHRAARSRNPGSSFAWQADVRETPGARRCRRYGGASRSRPVGRRLDARGRDRPLRLAQRLQWGGDGRWLGRLGLVLVPVQLARSSRALPAGARARLLEQRHGRPLRRRMVALAAVRRVVAPRLADGREWGAARGVLADAERVVAAAEAGGNGWYRPSVQADDARRVPRAAVRGWLLDRAGRAGQPL